MNDESFQNKAVVTYPFLEKEDFTSINKNYIKVIYTNLFIVFSILFTSIIVLDTLEYTLDFVNSFLYFYLGLTLLFLILLVFLFISFKRRKYLVREKDISYQRGVFIHTLTTVPFTRIQHVEIDEGPISRILNLASLSVYTAGDSSDDLEIRGIKKDEALKIKEFISSKIND